MYLVVLHMHQLEEIRGMASKDIHSLGSLLAIQAIKLDGKCISHTPGKVVLSQDVVFDGSCFPRLALSDMPLPLPITVFDDLSQYEPYDSVGIDAAVTDQDDNTYPNEPLTPLDSGDDSDLMGVALETVGVNI